MPNDTIAGDTSNWVVPCHCVQQSNYYFNMNTTNNCIVILIDYLCINFKNCHGKT